MQNLNGFIKELREAKHIDKQFLLNLCDNHNVTFRWLSQKYAKSNDEFTTEFKNILYSFLLDKNLPSELKKYNMNTLNTILIYISNRIDSVLRCEKCGKVLQPKEKIDRQNFCINCWTKDKDVLSIKQKRIQESVKRKYGVDNVSKLDNVKKKISAYRIMHKEKENEKRTKTVIERYGVRNVMFDPDIYTKWKEVMKTKQDKCLETRMKYYKEIGHPINTIPGMREKLHRGILRKNYDVFLEKLKMYNLSCKITRDEYESLNAEYTYICNNCGHVFTKKAELKLFCPNCSKQNKFQSKLEEIIYNCIKEVYSGNIIRNTKSVIPPYELDIYVPEMNIAFEINGTYWHSDFFKDFEYHQKKTLLCMDNGVRLIHIFEHDYAQNGSKLLEFIKNLFVKSHKRVYARKCYVNIIDKEGFSKFLEQYHLKGHHPCKYMYGLFFKDQLVAVMGLSKNRFEKDNSSLEVIRYCVHPKYAVIGGLDKLIAYVLNNLKKDILTYIDLTYFTGSSFKQSKYFKFSHITSPNYVYVNLNNGDIISRYKAQKHKLCKLLGDSNFSEVLTEYENMVSNGWVRVYDSGNIVYKTS